MGKDFLKVLGKLWGRGQSQFRGVLGVKSPKISVFRGGDKGRILGDFPLYRNNKAKGTLAPGRGGDNV